MSIEHVTLVWFGLVNRNDEQWTLNTQRSVLRKSWKTIIHLNFPVEFGWDRLQIDVKWKCLFIYINAAHKTHHRRLKICSMKMKWREKKKSPFWRHLVALFFLASPPGWICLFVCYFDKIFFKPSIKPNDAHSFNTASSIFIKRMVCVWLDFMAIN